MALPDNLFATAFRQQRLGLMFAAIMAIMVYLATLALAAQISIAKMAFVWSHDLQGSFTIEIPPSPSDAPKAQVERTQKIVSALRTLPGVAEVMPLSDEETAQLLKPWINEPAVLRSLPLPVLIDVRMGAQQTIEANVLQDKLAAIAPEAQVNNHAEELAPLQHLIQGFGVLGGLMIVLTSFTLIITISLICRAAMAVQRETLDLLHLIGTVNTDIACQFQFHTCRLAWPAAVGGFVLALLTAGLLLVLYGHFGPQPPAFNVSWLVSIGIMALVPVAAVIVAVVTARYSVLSLLKQMP